MAFETYIVGKIASEINANNNVDSYFNDSSTADVFCGLLQELYTEAVEIRNNFFQIISCFRTHHYKFLRPIKGFRTKD